MPTVNEGRAVDASVGCGGVFLPLDHSRTLSEKLGPFGPTTPRSGQPLPAGRLRGQVRRTPSTRWSTPHTISRRQ